MLPTFPTFIFRISGHEETEEDKLASLIVPYFTWEQRKPNRSISPSRKTHQSEIGNMVTDGKLNSPLHISCVH